MDHVLVKILILDELELLLIFCALIACGGFAGALLLKVKTAWHRSLYLCFIAFIGLVQVSTNFGWALVPQATEAGMISVLLGAMLAAYFLFGMATYFAGAARSNDMRGNTKAAWASFVPIANLWLVLAKGQGRSDKTAVPTSRAGRLGLNAGLVVVGLASLVTTQVIEKNITTSAGYDIKDSAKLVRLMAQSQTLEASFATEAKLSRRELPTYVDEITVFSEIMADGDTLLMVFDLQEQINEINPDFEAALSAEYCRADMFAFDIARGGRLILAYRDIKGDPLGKFEITQEDCTNAFLAEAT